MGNGRTITEKSTFQNTGCIKKRRPLDILKFIMFLSTIDFRSLGIPNGSNRAVELFIVILVTFVRTPNVIQAIVSLEYDYIHASNSRDQTSFVL